MRCTHSELPKAVLLVAMTAALCGCQSMEIEPPSDFLQMTTASREIRLTTAEQARVWVREFVDPDRGNVEFWAAALRNDLVGRRGYELVDEGELTDGRGQPGAMTRYATTIDGEPCGYLTVLWVDAGGNAHTIRVAEFVAPIEEFEARIASVRSALGTLRP